MDGVVLLAGLGNPGKEYEATRHNAGFMAVDEIIRRHAFSATTRKFHARVNEGRLEGLKALTLCPETYMNRSGLSVLEASSFYKIPPENVIVLHDDIDLPLGKVRAKIGGGHGGHNGLKSIDDAIGKEYHRVRIGVGHPGARAQVSNFVLGGFGGDEKILMGLVVDAVAEAIGLLITRDHAAFMNKVTLLLPQEEKIKKTGEEKDGV